MIKNVKLYSLFESFLETLNFKEIDVYERKLINLIINDFDSVAAVGSYKGQRALLIAELISKSGKETSDSVTLRSKSSDKEEFPIKKILSLEVNKFRGFTNKEVFQFDKKYTLVYGPNGSGKSSFCDALEYALLGYINEAIAKRIDVDKYISNGSSGEYIAPIVKAINHKDEIVGIEQMPEIYNFCFIEKNRISNFSRISANTPAGQRDLLSTLFGLEEFNKFAMNFTDEFAKYIDIAGKKKVELDGRKQAINEAEINIKNANEGLLKLEDEKKAILADGKNYTKMDAFIHGNKNGKDEKNSEKKETSPEAIGRIKVIEQELSKPVAEIYSVTKYENINLDLVAIETLLEDYKSKKNKYMQKKDAVNYKKLYEAVIELEKKSKGICPACQTPLDKTVINPFEHAQQEINKLGEIAELEKEIENAWSDFITKKNALSKEMAMLRKIATKLGVGFEFDAELLEKITLVDKGGNLEHMTATANSIRSNQAQFETLSTKTEIENAKISDMAVYREKLSSEKARLSEISDLIKGIKTREGLFKETVSRESATVTKFAADNQALIDEVEQEKIQIVENQKYLEAYKAFIGRLKAYNQSLPLRLVENLNDLTREFYNAININDKKFELLSSVELPVNPEGIIKIKFNEDGDVVHDALRILSEGHIRCLGLAILLAKVVSDGKGIMIFDDVVNAIDDEHRGGIREVLFKDERLKDKQIILTSHAEEFIKDLDNQFTLAEYQELVKRITFLRPSDARSILVATGETTFNYLVKAESCLNRENKRDSLVNCRRALENITNSLWGRLGKIYKTELTVKLRSPKTSPDLMGVVQELRKKMENNQYFGKEVNDQIVEDFKYLEGLESTNKNIWGYLNKGTHEESDNKEFDKTIVEKILTLLKRLNDNAKKDRETVGTKC